MPDAILTGTHRFVHFAALVEESLQALVVLGGRERGRGRAVLGREEGARQQVAAVVQIEVATPPAAGQPANGQDGKQRNGEPHVADGQQWRCSAVEAGRGSRCKSFRAWGCPTFWASTV